MCGKKYDKKLNESRHPLDERVASGWPANPAGKTFDLPVDNYHRKVYSDIITLICDEQKISEKDFRRIDVAMVDADKLVRENDPIVIHCKKQHKRSDFCAELIWSRKMGRDPFTIAVTESRLVTDCKECLAMLEAAAYTGPCSSCEEKAITEKIDWSKRLDKLRARRDPEGIEMPEVTTTAGHGIPQDDDDAAINAACGEPVAPPVGDNVAAEKEGQDGVERYCPQCGCTWHSTICGHCGGKNKLCTESLKRLLPLIEQKTVTADDFNAFINESLPKSTHERIMRHTRMTGVTPKHATPANKVDDKTDHKPGRHNDPTTTARGKRTVALQGKRNQRNANKFKPGNQFGEAIDFIRTKHGKAITEAELNNVADHIALYRLTTRLLATPSEFNKDWLFRVHRMLTEKINKQV